MIRYLLMLCFLGNSIFGMEQIIESKGKFAFIVQNRFPETIVVTLRDKKQQNLVNKQYLSSMQTLKINGEEWGMNAGEICGWYKEDDKVIYFPLFLLMGKAKDDLATIKTIDQKDHNKIFIYDDTEEITKT